MLYYGVCYYYDRQHVEGLIQHLAHCESLGQANANFVVVAPMDSQSESKRIRQAERLKDQLSQESSHSMPIHVVPCFNWGGTVAALYVAFKRFRSAHPQSHLAMFEEDFLPYNNLWLAESQRLLSMGNIYVGEHAYNRNHSSAHRPEGVKEIIDDCRVMGGRTFKDVHKSYGLATNGNSRYTDGGFYFSTMDKFRQIEEKIGLFHKGNQKSRWNHCVDGIILGEVGFPSEVALHFPFVGLERQLYFKHEGKLQGDPWPNQ